MANHQMINAVINKEEKYITAMRNELGYSEDAIYKVIIGEMISDEVNYYPHQKQAEVHNAINKGAKNVIACWGRRTGKTESMAFEAMREMVPRPTRPVHMPVLQTSIVAPSFKLTEKVFRYVISWIKRHKVLDNITKSLGYRYELRSASEFKNYVVVDFYSDTGKFIQTSKVLGATTGEPDSVLGDPNALVIIDEAARAYQKVIEEGIKPTLTDLKGILVMISTPKGFNFFYDYFVDWKYQNEENGSLEFFASHATSHDNPYLPEGEIDKVREEYIRTGQYEIFRQEYLAEFVSKSGMVIPFFDKKVHVVDGLKPDPATRISVGIDWGFRAPASIMFGQIFKNGRVHILHNVYKTGLISEKVGEIIQEYLQKHNFQLNYCYADLENPEAISILRKMGLRVWRNGMLTNRNVSMRDVQARLNLLRTIFSMQEIDEKPAILIDSSCKNLVKEIELYRYSEKEDERPSKECSDHAVDSLGYMLMGGWGDPNRAREIIWG